MVRDLVVQAQNGDRDAFAALVHMTSDRMYALAARILRDNDLAEDALQGALITVWRQLPTLRDPDRFEAWVRRLLVHACYAEARRRRSWAANVRVLPVDGPAAPDGLVSIDDRDALDRAFRRLTVEQRAVFVLHHHVGPAADRDRRHARHPGRDGPLATPLRDAGAARGRRGRRGAGRPRRTDGMTDERDFDRLARAWLELGPDEAPDRVDRRRPPGHRDDAAGAATAALAHLEVLPDASSAHRRRRRGDPRRRRRRRILPVQIERTAPSVGAAVAYADRIASPAATATARRRRRPQGSRTRLPSCGWAHRARSRASRRTIDTGSS